MWQGREVVGVEILQDREPRVLDPRRDRVGGAGRQLGLGQAKQEGCDRAGAIDYAAFLGFFSAEPS